METKLIEYNYEPLRYFNDCLWDNVKKNISDDIQDLTLDNIWNKIRSGASIHLNAISKEVENEINR